MAVHQRTPKGFAFVLCPVFFMSVVINSISQLSIQTEDAYFKYIGIISHLSVNFLSWFPVVTLSMETYTTSQKFRQDEV